MNPSTLLLLRAFFVVVLAGMAAVTVWASWHTPLFELPREVWTHPWFLATLSDAYFGFLTFYLWVAWKEPTAGARLLWAVAILLLGNFAMAGYGLRETFRAPRAASFGEWLARRNEGTLLFPGLLVLASVGVYLLA